MILGRRWPEAPSGMETRQVTGTVRPVGRQRKASFSGTGRTETERIRVESGRGTTWRRGSVVGPVDHGVESLAGVLWVDPFLDEVDVGEVGQCRPDAPL